MRLLKKTTNAQITVEEAHPHSEKGGKHKWGSSQFSSLYKGDVDNGSMCMICQLKNETIKKSAHMPVADNL